MSTVARKSGRQVTGVYGFPEWGNMVNEISASSTGTSNGMRGYGFEVKVGEDNKADGKSWCADA